MALRARGHDVVVLSTSGAQDWFSNLGFAFRAHRRVPFEDWTRPETSPWRADRFRTSFLDAIPAQSDDVADCLAAERFDLVLADSTVTGAGLAAEKAGVPWASYVTFFLDEDRPPDDTFRVWWDEVRAGVGLPPDPRPAAENRWVALSANLTLLLGLPELVPNRAVLPPYVHRVGPTTWDVPLAEPVPDWLAGLGRVRPAVLVSTSSAWLDDAELVVRTGQALERRGVDVVATVVAQHDVAAVGPNVRVTSYCPHGLLLPRLRAVVCSGGFGVTTRALCAGIPLVLVPQGGETQRVALAVARVGAGIALHHRRYTTAGLGAALNRLLADGRYTAAARRLQEAGSRYNAPEVAADLIEERFGLGAY